MTNWFTFLVYPVCAICMFVFAFLRRDWVRYIYILVGVGLLAFALIACAAFNFSDYSSRLRWELQESFIRGFVLGAVVVLAISGRLLRPKTSNQSTDPTLASGTPPAAQESRHP
jgi:hypothetical protein